MLGVTEAPRVMRDGGHGEDDGRPGRGRARTGRDPQTGKRQRRALTVQRTKKLSEVAPTQEAAIAGGTFVDPSEETDEAFLRRWLRDYVEASLRCGRSSGLARSSSTTWCRTSGGCG